MSAWTPSQAEGVLTVVPLVELCEMDVMPSFTFVLGHRRHGRWGGASQAVMNHFGIDPPHETDPIHTSEKCWACSDAAAATVPFKCVALTLLAPVSLFNSSADEGSRDKQVQGVCFRDVRESWRCERRREGTEWKSKSLLNWGGKLWWCFVAMISLSWFNPTVL